MLARQGREAALWAAVQEVAEEGELGWMCCTSGSCCWCWAVRGSLSVGCMGDGTCCGRPEVRGFPESVRGDGCRVCFPAAAWW